MDRAKLAKYILLFLAVPFAVYLLVQVVAGYIPPTESNKKAPFQFEEAFNEQMSQYGMSIDLDSVNYSYGNNISKTVFIVCEDGSNITCKIYTTSDRRKALIEYIVFEQELTGEKGEAVYLEPLLRFILDEFMTAMSENKDETLDSYSSVSYMEAVHLCRAFIGGEEKEEEFFVSPDHSYGTAVMLKREADVTTRLSISLHLFNH